MSLASSPSPVTWADPVRASLFDAWLAQLAPRHGLQPQTLQIASADASFRRYLRILGAAGQPARIIMDAPPEKENCHPFVHVARLMEAAGLHAPRVLEWDEANGFMLLTDLGDATMMSALDPARPEAAQPLYLRALDVLLPWQQASRPAVLPPYDEALLRRELQLFPDWYIAQQAGDVVGDGAVHRVLEVQHAEPHPGGRHHEVAHHEVAVHEHAGCGQAVGDNAVEGLGQRGLLRSIERHATVPGHVPVREKLQLAAQQRLVIGRQHARARGLLPVQQRIHRQPVPVQRGQGIFRVQDLDHRLRAQVRQEHETMGLVPGQDLGHPQARLLHQRLHLDEGAAILFVRGRVHHHQAGTAGGIQAQVASETRVRGCRPQGFGTQAVDGHQRGNPGAEGGLARRIGPKGGGWCGGRGGKRGAHG